MFPALALLVACGHGRGDPFVWVHELAKQPSSAAYVITPGDTLNIRVWNQEGLSGRFRVREDGRISLAFLNDVLAAGLEPNALAQQLQTRLKEFIVTPVVTVALDEARPFNVSVVGEVGRPGVYALEPSSGVLTALASAGGFNEYANKHRIFVLRQDPEPTRIRFTYEALTRSTGPAAAFRLRAGDVIVVE